MDGIRKWISTGGIVICLMTLGSSWAAADQVVFKNGDQLTGKIESANGGKLVINSAVAGKITVDLKNVKTFSTDEPIKLLLNDGTVVDQQVTQSTEGNVRTAPGGTLAPQDIALGSVTKINPPPVAWTGSIVANGLISRGNVDSEQLGVAVAAARRTDDDRVTVGGQYLFAQQKINGSTNTTEDNWFIAGKYDYFFTKRLYATTSLRVEKDRIQGLDLRLTPSAGMGYQWFETPDFNMNTEVGGAWVYERFTNQPEPREDFSARLAYHVDKSFDDGKYKLFNNVQYFPSVVNVNNYIVLGDVGIRVDLTKNMFSEFKIQANYDSRPAPGNQRTDVKYILGVGWSF